MAAELLYIDLFCGAGGTSTGVERARLDGRKCARVIAGVEAAEERMRRKIWNLKSDKND